MGKDSSTAQWGRDYKAIQKAKKARTRKEILGDLRVLREVGVGIRHMDRKTGHWRIIHKGKSCDVWETTGTVKFGKKTYSRHGAAAVRVASEHLGIGIDWTRP